MLAHGQYGPGGDSAITGAEVLDAFAGTGAFAFEALSRGAASATLLEINAHALNAARVNAVTLGEKDRTLIRRMDATQPSAATTAHGLVFLDPPYGMELGTKSLKVLAAKGWIAIGGLAIAEVAAGEEFAPPAEFTLINERVFSAARFVIMRYKNQSHTNVSYFSRHRSA